jgi:thioredoxin 1
VNDEMKRERRRFFVALPFVNSPHPVNMLRAVGSRLRVPPSTLPRGMAARWLAGDAGAVAELTSDAEIEAVVAATKNGPPLLLNFTAAWCGPCRAAAPRVAALAAAHAGKVAFAKIDIDREEVLRSVSDAGITAVPTFQLYVNGGDRVAEIRGADVVSWWCS